MMKEIKTWETSDGRLFKFENQASEHELALHIKESIDIFVDRHICSEISKDDVADLLFEHRGELYEILKQIENYA